MKEKLLYNGEIYVKADSSVKQELPERITYNGEIYVKADSSENVKILGAKKLAEQIVIELNHMKNIVKPPYVDKKGASDICLKTKDKVNQLRQAIEHIFNSLH